MVERWLALLVLGLGCSGTSTPSPAGPTAMEETPEETGADDAPGSPCEDKPALAAALASRWQVANDHQVGDLNCAVGRFPEPGYVVDAWIQPVDTERDDGTFRQIREVIGLDGGGSLGRANGEDGGRAWLAGGTIRLQTADLDGDGTDEILLREHFALNGGGEMTNLLVLALDGSGGLHKGGAHLVDELQGDDGSCEPEDDDCQQVRCDATVTLAGPGADGARWIVLDWGTPEPPATTEDCQTGTETLRWVDGALVSDRAAK